ncbi:hypothetical protein AN958_01631 [Leucoagaricus sp. SymC.cos]|nr:hypothetical protein AN958_01631 [Leucoagaricus sp. SymC.cos]
MDQMVCMLALTALDTGMISTPTGLKTLFDSSMPEAAHDASTHPPSCLPGTREQYITEITLWASQLDRQCPVLWVNGPAGVGKSAVAQTCAEKLEKQSLGAAFFFSGSNERTDAQRFFPTIAYQLTGHFQPYADHLEKKIRNDPSLLTKSLDVQFRELISAPFEELYAQGERLAHDSILIVDGLDECEPENAQRDIIRIILGSTSLRELPFSWAIFSRPEPHLESTFQSLDPNHSLLWSLTIVASGASATQDIELYLRSGFRDISSKSDPQWPSEDEIQQLVRKADGLFIYAASVLRFLRDPDLPDPEKQLTALLSRKAQPGRILSELDSFYTLIMELIPSDTLSVTLTLLLLVEYRPAVCAGTLLYQEDDRALSLLEISNLLGYSTRGVAAALNRLRSVIRNRKSETKMEAFSMQDSHVSYYHASFQEFIKDSTRSGQFCIYQTSHYSRWADRCLQVINESHSSHGVQLANWHPVKTDVDEATAAKSLESSLVGRAVLSLLHACARADLRENLDLLERLQGVDYRSALDRCSRSRYHLEAQDVLSCVEQIGDDTNAIVRKARPLTFELIQSYYQLRRNISPKFVKFVFPVYKLGHGTKSILLWPDEKSPFVNPLRDSDDLADKICYHFARPSSINGGHFEDHTQVHNHFYQSSGLQILLDSSLPEAAHNSCHTSRSCLSGTREQYINDITGWVRAHNVPQLPGESPRDKPKPPHKLLWFNGPLGVGKSAIAQTCAEMLQETAELGAAFFFSRPNRLDDPTKFFLSIAYQLATRLQPTVSLYGLLLEEIVRNDPGLVTKSLRVQVQKLLIEPILALLSRTAEVVHHRALIIVDGLDEANGHDTQCEILRLISQITLDYPTLPLLWAVFSRPELHIKYVVQELQDLWWEIPLVLSSDTHRDIELYLQTNFRRMQKQYDSPLGSSQEWPSEADIKALVQKSGGLFVFAANIVRFFDNPMLLDREKQLANLLSSGFQTTSSALDRPPSSLAHLDSFYTAIMQRVPCHILFYTLNTLLVLSSGLISTDLSLTIVSNLLDYPISTLLSALYPLHSVLFQRGSSGAVVCDRTCSTPPKSTDIIVGFYHYSFLEFLRAPSRSEFGTSGGLCGILLKEYQSVGEKEEIQRNLLVEASCSLLSSCAHISTLSDHADLIFQLNTLDFRKIVSTVGESKQHLVMCIREEALHDLINQLNQYTKTQPWTRRAPQLIRERLQILNSLTRKLLYHLSPNPSARVYPVYELGHGDKMVYLYPENTDSNGVVYHVCMSSDELNDPYIFTDGNEILS